LIQHLSYLFYLVHYILLIIFRPSYVYVNLFFLNNPLIFLIQQTNHSFIDSKMESLWYLIFIFI